MNIAELKLEIIAKIIATDDVSLLNQIKEIIDSFDTDLFLSESTTTYEEIRVFSDEEVHFFTPEQRKRVLNSLEQCKEGNTMTDEEAQADIQKWL